MGMERNGTECNEGEDRGKGESCVARGSYELSLSLVPSRTCRDYTD